mmetsp:Transcript_5928/g.12897  ORF Transcript_5928/g.12897 Transcript_5928/m.12897 type:complete len:85 (-) Transcript_5928:200-454(-)
MLRIASRRCIAASAARRNGPPCGTACGTPEACSMPTQKTDLAHKAVGSEGATYGYSKKYAQNWEKIFGKKDQQGEATEKKHAEQ